MKRILTTLALGCAVLLSYAQDPNFYIYLAIGQSNMVGQAPLTAQDSIVSERFLNLTASDCDTHPMCQWRKAVPPLARQWTKLEPYRLLRTHDAGESSQRQKGGNAPGCR